MLTHRKASDTDCPYSYDKEIGDFASYCKGHKCPKWRESDDIDFFCSKQEGNKIENCPHGYLTLISLFDKVDEHTATRVKCHTCEHRYGYCAS